MKILLCMSALFILNNAYAKLARIHPNGIGTIKIGMTERQAGRILHTQFIRDAQYDRTSNSDGDCYFSTTSRDSNINLMIWKHQIVSILYTGDYPHSPDKSLSRKVFLRDSKGNTLGDSLQKLWRSYPKGQLALHKDDGYGSYYYVWSKRKTRGIRYDYDPTEGKITAIYAGDASIFLKEGCA